MHTFYRTIVSAVLLLLYVAAGSAKTVHIPVSEGDMTLKIRGIIDSSSDENLKIVLEKGTYFFRPDYATEKYCAITNHGNGSKKILFALNGKKSVEIEGNGAKLLFHGQMFPFLFEDCGKVTVSDLTIDWDIPFTFLAEVMAVNPSEGWREVKPMQDGFSWSLKKDRISFPEIDGFSYMYLGSTLPFDKETKRVVDGALDVMSIPTKVEKLGNGNLRIYEDLKYYPPIGSLLSSKGDRDNDRYAPAFDFKECRNVCLQGITIHHALGMGFLFERTENICIRNSRIVLSPGTDRVISTTADATHFCNCKGDILIEGCRFENMLDDGTNVHGTYMEVDKVLDKHTLRASLKHFEQSGFKFADTGDEIWLICQPSVERAYTNKVTCVRVLNEKFIEYTFESPLPAGLKKGDLLENKTWNPSFTMRGCTIRHHRARNIVLKTPGRILIEDNTFSSMMSSILFRGESHFWFESGAVIDVLIRNNRFNDCAYCSTQHAVVLISPRMGKGFSRNQIYDRNIRFIDNEIIARNPVIFDGNCTENITIKGNRIEFLTPSGVITDRESAFIFRNCTNVTIEDNSLSGEIPSELIDTDKPMAYNQ